LPGVPVASLALYVLLAGALVFVLLSVWARRSTSFESVWTLTVLVAVLVDPHLVDYDLTVLVSAGIVASALVPQLAWLIIPLYLATLLRAQIPLGPVSFLLTTPLLGALAVFVARDLLPGSASSDGQAPAPLRVETPLVAQH